MNSVTVRRAIHTVSGRMRDVVEEHQALKMESRELRRSHFEDVKRSVAADAMGFPSVESMMAPKSAEEARIDYHPIEAFQRTKIYTNVDTTLAHMKEEKIFWQFFSDLLFGLSPHGQKVYPEYLSHGISDKEFDEIFTTRWGAELLRPWCEGDGGAPPEAGAGAGAVVCDTWPFLLDLPVQPGMWLEPAQVVFAQGRAGLQVASITTRASSGDPATRFTCADGAEWLWAKRMAVSACYLSHQLQYHLVFQHMAVEVFVALAYKHTSQKHFVFRLLEPLCGDVGFINRSWGIEAIVDWPTPEGKRHKLAVPSLTSLTAAGCYDAVVRAQGMMEASDLLWFEEGAGYMKGGSGVEASTPFPYRDTGNQIFDAMHRFVEGVVRRFWRDGDEELGAWWEAVWAWEVMTPARRPLTQPALSHLLATLCFTATYRHDHSHDEWCWRNHAIGGMSLRRGARAEPQTYLPKARISVRTRALMMSLSGGNIENPLTGYVDAFPELKEEVGRYCEEVRDIILGSKHYQHIGTMTH